VYGSHDSCDIGNILHILAHHRDQKARIETKWTADPTEQRHGLFQAEALLQLPRYPRPRTRARPTRHAAAAHGAGVAGARGGADGVRGRVEGAQPGLPDALRVRRGRRQQVRALV
jgi:hypothetical protein